MQIDYTKSAQFTIDVSSKKQNIKDNNDAYRTKPTRAFNTTKLSPLSLAKKIKSIINKKQHVKQKLIKYVWKKNTACKNTCRTSKINLDETCR